MQWYKLSTQDTTCTGIYLLSFSEVFRYVTNNFELFPAANNKVFCDLTPYILALYPKVGDRWFTGNFGSVLPKLIIIIIIIIIIIMFINSIGLSPGGSGYFTCKQNMKLVNDKFRFKSVGLHEKHVVATWNVGSHLSICL